MSLSLDHYLNEQFPSLLIESPLFYNADIGIRFEIGNPDPSVSDEAYYEQVKLRRTQLFKEAHHADDEIYILLYLYLNRKHTKIRKFNMFRQMVKDKKILRNLSCSSVIDESEDEDEEEVNGRESYRYVLKCKVSDIKISNFLASNYYIFMINTSKHTIFYNYDSRGLDIVSNQTEALRNLYLKYNDWILDYDREAIDAVFLS